MLRSALGSDFGLADDVEGFDKTAAFRLHVCGPSGLAFNYADSNAERMIFDSASSWLALRFGNSDETALARRGIEQVVCAAEMEAQAATATAAATAGEKKRKVVGNRATDAYFVLSAVWFPSIPPTCPTPPKPPLDAHFRGSADLALFRSSWGDDGDAHFLGFKCGSNEQTHGHLDLGSFILEMRGRRFAMDLGKDDYALKSYHSRRPESPRWTTYMRTSTWGHNCLVVGDGASRAPGSQPAAEVVQDCRAKADIVSFVSTSQWAHAVADLSEAYPLLWQRGAKKAKKKKEGPEEGAVFASRNILRGVALIDRALVLIQDEIVVTPSPPSTHAHALGEQQMMDVIWRMFTEAEVQVVQPSVVLLTLQGQLVKAEISFCFVEDLGEGGGREGGREEVSGVEFHVSPATPKEYLEEEGGKEGGKETGKKTDKKPPLGETEAERVQREKNMVIRQNRNEGIRCLSIHVAQCIPPRLSTTASPKRFSLGVVFSPMEGEEAPLGGRPFYRPLGSWGTL